jgi:hypothetical protein
MGATIVALGSPSVILALLVVERAVLRRLHRKVLVRITVLGTRGKSRVARLVAFELRADGRCVVHEMTGSRPVLGNVNGTEQVMKWRGLPTLLERRRALSSAARQVADVAVWRTAAAVLPGSAQHCRLTSSLTALR